MYIYIYYLDCYNSSILEISCSIELFTDSLTGLREMVTVACIIT